MEVPIQLHHIIFHTGIMWCSISVSIRRQFGMYLHWLFWSGHTFWFWGWVWRTSSRKNDLGIPYKTIVYAIVWVATLYSLSGQPEHCLSRHFNIICHLPSASTICYLHKSSTTSVPSMPSVHLDTITYYANLFIFM